MRVRVLDSLRGLAAFMVVLYHAWQTLPPGPLADGIRQALLFTPFKSAVGARPAVILFFVLSGYVLALALTHGPGTGWGGFVLRRICRVWLPFAVSILLSAGLYWLMRPTALAGVHPWFNADPWSAAPDAETIWRHLAMLGDTHSAHLNVVMWSLTYELRISLVFPLLLLAVQRLPLRVLLPGMLALQVGTDATMRWLGLPLAPFFGDGWVGATLTTLHFVNCFLVGALLALRGEAVQAALARLPGWTRAGLWLAAMLLLGPSIDYTCTLGAALLMALAIGSPTAQRLLEVPPLLWLGKVSYSLYLVHVPVLLVVVHGLHGWLPLEAMLLLAILLALPAAEAMNRWVEQPSMTLARRLPGAAPHPARPVPG
ncbi:acyltransferase family protein [Dankookia sp. GCM10030260]|uniref:acyltransferase family protein n=1 Tax=Dankookia sp. GCM10030260 TaxID=3273390 RepID=UPI0036215B73